MLLKRSNLIFELSAASPWRTCLQEQRNNVESLAGFASGKKKYVLALSFRTTFPKPKPISLKAQKMFHYLVRSKWEPQINTRLNNSTVFNSSEWHNLWRVQSWKKKSLFSTSLSERNVSTMVFMRLSHKTAEVNIFFSASQVIYCWTQHIDICCPHFATSRSRRSQLCCPPHPAKLVRASRSYFCSGRHSKDGDVLDCVFQFFSRCTHQAEIDIDGRYLYPFVPHVDITACSTIYDDTTQRFQLQCQEYLRHRAFLPNERVDYL